MANSKSALKRVQVSERNRLRNRAYKSAVKTLMKKFFTAVDRQVTSSSPEAMEEVQYRFSITYSKIDKAVKRGVLHPNSGARKKSRLAQAFKRCENSSSSAVDSTPLVG